MIWAWYPEGLLLVNQKLRESQSVMVARILLPGGMPLACCANALETEWAPIRAASSRGLIPLSAHNWIKTSYLDPGPKA